LTWSQLAWIGGFINTARIAFSGRQNEEKLLIGSHVVFSKSLMTYEKSHCQASKMPNRGFLDAIYL
jgi:hypothetical protein